MFEIQVLTKESRTFFQTDSINPQKDMGIPSNAVHVELVILLNRPKMSDCITIQIILLLYSTFNLCFLKFSIALVRMTWDKRLEDASR